VATMRRCTGLPLGTEGVELLVQSLLRRLPYVDGTADLLHGLAQSEEARPGPMGASNIPGDGAQRAVSFAIQLQAIVQDLDLAGPAVPLRDQMGPPTQPVRNYRDPDTIRLRQQRNQLILLVYRRWIA